jgi:hypothetical protein
VTSTTLSTSTTTITTSTTKSTLKCCQVNVCIGYPFSCRCAVIQQCICYSPINGQSAVPCCYSCV